MRYLVARGPDGQGVIAGARTIPEAKLLAAPGPAQPTTYIICTRTGRVRDHRGRIIATRSTTTGGTTL